MREPLAKLAIRATLPRGEASRILRTQLCTQAAANFEGTLAVPLLALSQFKLDGKAVLSGLDWEQGRIHIRNGSVDSNLAIDIDGIQATSIVARALDATFRGRASIKSYSALHAEGNLSNLDVHSAGAMFSDRQFPWSGTLAGPVTIDAQKDVEGASVRADLTVTPGASNPIDGHIALSYDPGAGTFDLGSSYLATAASRIDVSGLLGTNMRVALRSTSMEDLQTALDAAGWHETIPLKLRKGAVTANGSILGSLDAPRFRGNISATSATLQNHDFDRFAAEVEASGASVALQRIDAAVGEARASGNLTLNAPFENPGIAGDIVLRSTPAALLAQAAGWSEPISGVVGATLHLEGTLQHPQASGSVDVSSPTFLGEKLDRIRATIRASENLYEASNGRSEERRVGKECRSRWSPYH